MVPLPPNPYFKVEEKFPFDELMNVTDDNEKGGDRPRDRYNLFFIAFMVLGAGKQ